MHRLLHDCDGDVLVREWVEREARYHGMRLSAREYFELEEDGCRYELIDGVVCMTPSPNWRHQEVAQEISWQLYGYLKGHPVGRVIPDVDVHLGTGPRGGDLIYRPDIVFFKAGRRFHEADRIIAPPDLVVEVASLSTRRYDRETKKADYERFGVLEYWIVDPLRKSFEFDRLVDGRYVSIASEGNVFRSEAVHGFALDLAAVRRTFEQY